MNILLPRNLDDMIRRQVASGAYPSASHVIVEALLLFEEREEVRKVRRDRLLRELAKGVSQADNHQFVDEREVFTRLHDKQASTEL